MCTETTRPAWTQAFDIADADWRLPATASWPAFTLTVRERQDIALRLALTATGWIIANASLTAPLDYQLAEWQTLSLAEWYDRHAPESDLYGVLANELIGLWMRQADQAFPRPRAEVVKADLSDWAGLMPEAWDDEAVVASTEPIAQCYLELIRRLLDVVTVGAAWNAGRQWWQANVKTPRVLLPAALSFSASD